MEMYVLELPLDTNKGPILSNGWACARVYGFQLA